MQAVQHKLLNRAGSNCVTSNDYSLGSCIEGKISEKVGCKPLWINTSDIESPFCTHRDQYLEFMETLTKYEQMNTIQLNQLGCHKPCEFIEYKVEKTEMYRFKASQDFK